MFGHDHSASHGRDIINIISISYQQMWEWYMVAHFTIRIWMISSKTLPPNCHDNYIFIFQKKIRILGIWANPVKPQSQEMSNLSKWKKFVKYHSILFTLLLKWQENMKIFSLIKTRIKRAMLLVLRADLKGLLFELNGKCNLARFEPGSVPFTLQWSATPFPIELQIIPK